MRERQNEEAGDRPGTAASDAMLVTCIRCDTLHSPAKPLAFHPVCTACV
jgi:hypothetical protein